jgi:hypothetical protein
LPNSAIVVGTSKSESVRRPVIVPELDQIGHAGVRLDRVEPTEVGLDDHERLTVRCGVDPVDVEAWAHLEVAAEGHSLDVRLRAELPAGPDGHAVEHGRLGFGEPRGVLRDDDVVHEGRRACGQLVGGERCTGARVVDPRHAGRAAGDEDALAVDVDADRGAALLGRHEDVAFACAQVALVDGAGRDRADVERTSSGDVDALRLEAGRKRNDLRPVAGAGRRGRGEDERPRQHAEDAEHGQLRTSLVPGLTASFPAPPGANLSTAYEPVSRSDGGCGVTNRDFGAPSN